MYELACSSLTWPRRIVLLPLKVHLSSLSLCPVFKFLLVFYDGQFWLHLKIDYLRKIWINLEWQRPRTCPERTFFFFFQQFKARSDLKVQLWNQRTTSDQSQTKPIPEAMSVVYSLPRYLECLWWSCDSNTGLKMHILKISKPVIQISDPFS